jgi:hypothetical protein
MKRLHVVATILALCVPAPLFSQTMTDTSASQQPSLTLQEPVPNDANSRLNQLEMEIQALRAEQQYMREHPVQLPPVTPTNNAIPDPSATMTPAMSVSAEATPTANAGPAASSEYYTMDELRGEMRNLAWKKGDFSIVPYGTLWGNSVYTSERTSPGSYTLFVKSPSTAPADSEWLADGRNTRLGIDVGGPECCWLGGMQTGGKVEVDFQNSVLSTENKATILLRHAYVEAKNDENRLLFGQTWDVISPLNPTMLLYSVGWDGGNIGYRRAQIRCERYIPCSDTLMTTLQFSANEQVFEENSTVDVGKPSDWPIIEGRAAWTIGERGKDCHPIVFGASGHIGEEENDVTGGVKDVCRRTWSGNLDLRVPITDRLGLQGECYVGENLGAFLGGIGQGIDLTTLNTIRDCGGWIEVWYYWTPNVHTHVGYSVDDPNNHDISTTGEKTYNQFYYGNIMWDATKTCLIGLEVSQWRTLYYNQLPGDSLRCEFAVKYSF